MTMNTRVHIAKPINAKGLFDHILAILESDPDFAPRKATWREARKGETNEHGYVYDENGYCTTLGQGLACIWEVEYGADGPMKWIEDDDLDGSEGPMNEHLVSANFDTAYGYKKPNGAHCSDLHAFLLREIADYLDGVGVTEWVWLHEEEGTWHMPAEYRLRGDADLAAAAFGRDSQ